MHFVVERHYASSDTDLWHWMNIAVVEFSFFFCIKAEPTSLYSCNKIRKAENEFFKIRWVCKGQMKSKCIYEIIDFPKYHRKYLIDFCPASLFRLGLLCIHLTHWQYPSFYARKMRAQYWNHFWYIKWVIGTYGNLKNQNPGGRFGATS